MKHWNKRTEPISERLREEPELLKIISEKTLIYNPLKNQSALIMEVFKVDHDEDDITEGYDLEEDRWVEYITHDGLKENFSVDLDDEGWIWFEELQGDTK